MLAAEVSYEGALNLVGGFFHQVMLDLNAIPASELRGHVAAHEQVARASALAWLLDDSLTYDAMGLPVSFRAWCRFGNLNIDPEWLRAALLAGQAPGFVKYEDE